MYVHKYSRRFAYLLITGIALGATGSSYYIMRDYGIKAFLFYDSNYSLYLEHRPWFRLPAFLSGMLLGLVISRIHSARYEIHFSSLKHFLIQFFGAFLCLLLVFILKLDFIGIKYQRAKGFQQDEAFSSVQAALYTCIAPLFFNVGMTMILVPALVYTKKEGSQLTADLRSLMMYDGWRVLFKLCFAAYICHHLVIFWYYASIHSNGQILGRWLILRVAFGSFVLSFVIGLAFYLLIDKPIRNLDRLVLFPTKISDSFLIKKTQAHTIRAKQKTFAKGERKSTSSVRFSTQMSTELMRNIKKAEDEDDQQQNLNEELSQAGASDESEDEHTLTYRKAQMMVDSLTRQSMIQKRSGTSFGDDS